MRGRQAQCNGVVVATGAVADQLRMIELGWFPPQRAMAGIALRCSRHVITWETNGVETIVASLARRRRYARMIEACGSPGIGRMAGLASVAAGNVRLALSLRH